MLPKPYRDLPTLEFDTRIVRNEVKDKAGSALIAFLNLENTTTFLDLVLFSTWHTNLPVCQGSFANIPLLNQYCYLQPIDQYHL